jgi:serine/threonine protein kinase
MFNDVYKFKGLLGVGTFGVVMLVLNKETNEKCALKVIYKGRLVKEEVEVIRNESDILAKFRNKSNVVQFK